MGRQMLNHCATREATFRFFSVFIMDHYGPEFIECEAIIEAYLIYLESLRTAEAFSEGSGCSLTL